MRSILSDSCAIGSCDEKKKFSSICGFRSTNVATKPKRSTVSTTKNQWSQECPADATLRRCFFPITVADCASVNGQTGDLTQPSKPRNPEHYANPCRYTQKTVEQEHERELANAQCAAAKRTPFATVIWETAPPARRRIQRSLLLVVLDDLGGTHLGFIRVFAELTQCPALPQQVPTLVQMYFQVGQAGAIFTGDFTLSVELLFFLHQTIDVAEYGFVVFIHGHVRLLLGIARPVPAEGRASPPTDYSKTIRPSQSRESRTANRGGVGGRTHANVSPILKSNSTPFLILV